MRVTCEWTEEELIDLILEKERETTLWERFEAHLPSCQRCRFLFMYWEPLLRDQRDEQGVMNFSSKGGEHSPGQMFNYPGNEEGFWVSSDSDTIFRADDVTTVSLQDEWRPPSRIKTKLLQTLFSKKGSSLFFKKGALIATTSLFSLVILVLGLGVVAKPAGEKQAPAMIPHQTLVNQPSHTFRGQTRV